MGDLGIASEWEKPHKMLKQQKDKGRGEMGTRFVAGLDRSHVFSLSQTKSLELLRILKIPANGHTEACRLCGRPPERTAVWIPGFIYNNRSPCASYVSDTTQADARFPAQAIITQSSRPWRPGFVIPLLQVENLSSRC